MFEVYISERGDYATEPIKINCASEKEIFNLVKDLNFMENSLITMSIFYKEEDKNE